MSESKVKQEIIMIIKARDTPIGDKTMFGNQPGSFRNINFSYSIYVTFRFVRYFNPVFDFRVVVLRM